MTLLCEYEADIATPFHNSKRFLKLQSGRPDNANLAIVYREFVQFWDTTQSYITEQVDYNLDYEEGSELDITGDGLADIQVNFDYISLLNGYVDTPMR